MNCKPGVVAMVVKATLEKNNGKIVRVIESWDGQYVEGINNWRMSEGQCWVVESLGGDLYSSIDGVEFTKHQARPFEDRQLIRLDTDEDLPVEQLEMEKEDA